MSVTEDHLYSIWQPKAAQDLLWNLMLTRLLEMILYISCLTLARSAPIKKYVTLKISWIVQNLTDKNDFFKNLYIKSKYTRISREWYVTWNSTAQQIVGYPAVVLEVEPHVVYQSIEGRTSI